MRQAVILAGGRAMRMRPYTEDRPKAMVEVAGRPIIEHQLRWMAANRVKQVVISCGYRAEMLEEHLHSLRDLDLIISFAVEEEALGRGGGFKFAAGMLPYPKETWLGTNGDVVTHFPLVDLASHHRSLVEKFGVKATVALAAYRSNWGVAELDGELITGFMQSPNLPYWINAGIYALEPEVTKMFPDKGDHEDSTFPDLSENKELGAFKIDGYWRGIDTVKDVEEATAELTGHRY